jgi:2-polyprenyl-6-methoxyphenol hydroxylase-like FAD-dependent oxidoreductase
MKPDVIILGGGPNGLAAALSLGSEKHPRPLSVLLLDGRDPTVVPEDSRGTALTVATQSMFRALGMWDDLSAYLSDMRNIVVTDGVGTHDHRASLLNFSTAPTERAAAAMIENRHLSQALLNAVQKSPHITMLGGFLFNRCETSSARVTVHGGS